ncbi:xylose isomerase [Acidocella aquatica]|uniref:Xylose isomerase n=1 Tax=Acidocella aquatica TaxID=1922313 RepID=A0ABQ6ABS8_9PROT|nr:sugar phosphate isomerase/epimerase [Acidocella aquatica]GLR68251.1 xylose isomerase [Acidocella aquatica]
MHPSLSINTLCFGAGPLDAHAAQVARLGATAISPTLEQVVDYGAAAGKMLRDSGLAVATLTHRAFAFATQEDGIVGRERLNRTIDLAETSGAQTITLTTGGRAALRWPEAANRFAAEIAPCAARARAAGIKLSLEPTSHLYADASIAHRLADTLTLARLAGIAVGIDLFACWTDSDLEDSIIAAGPDIALVQVSDYVFGDRGLPCRALPGDGAVPLDRLIPEILRTGYSGYFDLEVIGSRLQAEGAEAGLRRAGVWLTELLTARHN